MGCGWWCRVIRECNCRLLDALGLITVASRCSWVASGPSGGAVFLGNATADCQTPYNGGLQGGPGLRLVVPCH